MREKPFTRPTILAAIEFLESHTQAGFDQMVLRLGREADIPARTDLSVRKKCGLLARAVIQQPDEVIATLGGTMTLAEAVVREAVTLSTESGNERPLQAALMRGLQRDGYVIEWDQRTGEARLRIALPEELKLPATDDEVRQLLKHFAFTTPLGHLEQAIEAHTRGDWAAANAQVRTFLESLFDDIARHIDPAQAAALGTSENRRRMLATKEFFSVARAEWSPDGKNYVNGLFKMLHTEGSHPGLSDEDHCTFRLHVILVTARTFLRRLYYKG
jgi:hypothetical protein